MGVNGFQELLDELPAAFVHVKLLCKKIRDILFPLLGDGALFKGTRPDSPEKLYDPIIEAFDRAIADITPGQESE